MRIVSFDLETTDLRANMGILLCGSFQPIVPEGYYSNHHDTPPKPYTFKLERKKGDKYNANPDRDLAVAIRDELEKYNLIVGFNSKLFDLPFLNSRLLAHNERRAHIQWHLDVMFQLRGTQNRIGGSSLLTAQQFLGIGGDDEGKTKLDWDIWKAAGLGDPKAMAEVMDHCERDVKVLAKAYWKLLGGVSQLERSR